MGFQQGQFNKDKCKVLRLGKHNPGVQHRLESAQLVIIPVERALKVLVDHKFNMSEQWAAEAKKVNRLLGYINKASPAEIKCHYSTLLTACQATPQILCSAFVLTIKKDIDKLE